MVHMDSIPPEFNFPENLGSLTDAQKEELYLKYKKHFATENTADLSPSKVIDIHSPEYKAAVEAKKAEKEAKLSELKADLELENEECKESSSVKFVEGVGYVCGPGEDLAYLAGRLPIDVLEQIAKKQANKATVVPAAQPAAPKQKAPPPAPPRPSVESEIDDRFDNLM
jgi:hypothetical protein